MPYDEEYCIHDYWLDYPRKDKALIDDWLTEKEKEKLLSGHTIAKPDRGGSYTQYFRPIFYNNKPRRPKKRGIKPGDKIKGNNNETDS